MSLPLQQLPRLEPIRPELKHPTQRPWRDSIPERKLLHQIAAAGEDILADLFAVVLVVGLGLLAGGGHIVARVAAVFPDVDEVVEGADGGAPAAD